MSESAPPLLKSGVTDVAVDQKPRIADGKQCHQMGLDSISSSSHCVGTASRDPTSPLCGLRRPLVHSPPILHFLKLMRAVDQKLMNDLVWPKHGLLFRTLPV